MSSETTTAGTSHPGRDPTAGGGRLGAYRLVEEIGVGGMSRVYLAERDDGQFQQRAAIKLIERTADAESIVQRFRVERQILASFEHPHIAHLFDGGETEDGRPYFALEYVDGVAIDLYCRHHELGLRERLKLFLDVCSAVGYAHRNLIVHRDIKPSNILVTEEGTAKLLDFGIAKILQPTPQLQSVELTVTDQQPMTLQYASPEQIAGGAITTATDVYALGLLLYELVSERRPYVLLGRSLAEMQLLICEREPPPPSRRVRGVRGVRAQEVAGEVDDVVRMAMAKEPERRYATVDQLAEDIRRFLAGLPLRTARPVTWRYLAGKLVRRNAWAVTTGVVFLGMLVGFVVALARQSVRLEEERDQARQVSRFLVDVFLESDPMSKASPETTAREILDRGAERLRRELVGQPLSRATLLTTIGRVYRNMDLFQEALPLLEEALALCQEHGDDRSPELVESLKELGSLYLLLGRLDEAQEPLERAVEIERRILGPDHPQLADSLRKLALFWVHRWDYGKAEKLYLEAIQVRLNDQHHPELAMTYDGLAGLYFYTGRYSEAGIYYAKALEIRREVYEPDHPEVVTGINNLALIQIEQARYEEAEQSLKEAFEIVHKARNHRRTAYGIVSGNLGSLYGLLRRFEEAEELSLESVRLEEEIRGDGNVNLINPLFDLAEVYYLWGRYEEAERHLLRAQAISDEKLTPPHPVAAETLLRRALVTEKAGDLQHAEELYVEALAMLRKCLGKEPSALWIQAKLAATYLGQGRIFERRVAAGEARESFRQALALTATLPTAEIVAFRDLHLKALVHAGRLDEARPLAADLWEKGWRDPDFVALSERHQLLR